MSEQTEYDLLSQSLREAAGPLDALVPLIQDGIEIEELLKMPAGKILVREALRASKEALTVLLHAESDEQEIRAAVLELRVQHRVLQTLSNTIISGRMADKQLQQLDHEEPT